MTNYLTGAEATQMYDAWGKLLQLWVDSSYSIMMFWINFSIANFTLILLLIVIAIIVGFGRKKIFGWKRQSSLVS